MKPVARRPPSLPTQAVDLSTLLSVVAYGAFLADDHGVIVAANERLAPIFGYEKDDLIGRRAESFLPESFGSETFEPGASPAPPAVALLTPSHAESFSRASDRRSSPTGAATGRRRDGSKVPVEVTINSLPEGDLVLGVVRDMTTRYRFEQELEAWSAVFEHAGFGVVIGDGAGQRLIRVNPAFAAMHGYTADELAGRPIVDVFAPAVRAEVAADLDLVHIQGRRVFESLHVRSDGRVFPVRVDATAVKDEDGEVLYRVALVEDLSERRESEAALQSVTDNLRRHANALERVNAALRRESAIADNIAEGVALIREQDGVFVYLNPAWEAMYGYGPGELLGRHVSRIVAPSDRRPAPLLDEFLSALHVEGEWRGEVRTMHKDGSIRWCQTNISTFEDPEHGRVWVAVNADITRRKQAERDLRASEERFRTVFEEAPLGMALVKRDGRLLKVNESMCEMLGFDAGDLTGVHLAELMADDDTEDGGAAPEAAAAIDEELLGRIFSAELASYHVERRLTTRRGQVLWTELRASLVPVSGDAPPYAIVMIEDITARKRTAARLAHMAMHDELTGLPNRSLAMDRLRKLQAGSERSGHYLAVIFLDLDGFKDVNDALGHEAGDAILTRVAGRLERSLRPTDTAARLGGDEFIVCCDDLGTELEAAEAEVHAIADRILESLSAPIHLPNGHVRVSGSIGIMLSRGTQIDAATLMAEADAAMYRAKARGPGQAELATHSADKRSSLRSGWLHQAVERAELEVYYQPVIDLRDGHVAGAEALVRWRHPTRGLLLPDEFLDTAERSGLIVSIGSWVLEHVLDQIRQWNDDGVAPPFVAVNVSSMQLDEPDFGPQVRRLLDAHGVDPGLLHLEIAERRFIEAAQPVLTALEGLRADGVHLGLDDFGTGWSSLTHLQRFPVDFLKIDRSFVADLLVSPSSEAIVTALVTLGGALGLDVIPEGIEEEAQAARLSALGCVLAQGWLFGRAQPAGDFERRLAHAPGRPDPGVTR